MRRQLLPHSREGSPHLSARLQRYNRLKLHRGGGRLAAEPVRGIHGKAVVQVTEHGYANGQAVDSLTFKSTSQI